MGRAAWPPVWSLPSESFFSSKPTQTPAASEGSKPMNQASVKSFVVPVLPAIGPLQRPGPRRRAALDHAAQQARHDVGGVGPDRVPGLGPVLLDHVAVAVGDARDEHRLHAQALVGEGGVGRRHLQRAWPRPLPGRWAGRAAARRRGRACARTRCRSRCPRPGASSPRERCGSAPPPVAAGSAPGSGRRSSGATTPSCSRGWERDRARRR